MTGTKPLAMAASLVIAMMLVGCGTMGPCNEDPSIVSVSYFDHAAPARDQLQAGNIPVAITDEGDVAILNMQVEPGSTVWEAGQIITLQHLDGSRSYELVLFSTGMADGSVGLISKDVGLLAAIDNAEINTTQTASFSSPAKARTAKTVTILDDSFETDRDILNVPPNMAILSQDGIELKIAEGYVHITPDVHFELTVNSISADAVETTAGWFARLRDFVGRKVTSWADGLGLSDGTLRSIEDLFGLAEELEASDELAIQLAAINDVLMNPSRIERAYVSISGEMRGKFVLDVGIEGEWVPDPFDFPLLTLPISVPLAPPLPMTMTLNAALVLRPAFHGKADFTAGFEFGTEIDSWAQLQNGQLSGDANLNPLSHMNGKYLRGIGPNNTDLQAEFSMMAGVQPRVGVSLIGMLEASVRPTAYAELVVSANRQGSSGSSCVRGSWDLYAGLDASLVVGAPLFRLEKRYDIIDPDIRRLLPGGQSWASSGCAASDTLSLDLGGGITMPLAEIPSGSFTMGSASGLLDEQPVHAVTIARSFYMSQYEVTQAQWGAVMGSNPSSNRASDNHPVEQVSWDDCVAFCNELSARAGRTVRLPTEAEWEYACRGGTATAYYFGDTAADLGSYAWYHDNSGNQTHAVGGKQPNAFGLHDMYGNVREWCGDWYDVEFYRVSPSTDPSGPASGDAKVARGGSLAVWAHSCRSADRGIPDATDQSDHYKGFRVVVEAQ